MVAIFSCVFVHSGVKAVNRTNNIIKPLISENSEHDIQEHDAEWYIEMATQIDAQYLRCEEDIQYYAYLDYNSALEQIKPVILQAREKIIYRQSWAADGTNIYILDENGHVMKDIPNFSDLFPADWNEPIIPKPFREVNLDHYAAPSTE